MIVANPAVCGTSDRRAIVKCQNAASESVRWNGLEYVELVGQNALGKLLVYFLCPVPKHFGDRGKYDGLKSSNFLLWDESTRTEIKIKEVTWLNDTCVQLTAIRTLCPGHCHVLTFGGVRVDPQFASFHFTAFAETTEIDPTPQDSCTKSAPSEPQPNYLARDYASFRQLLIDRLSLIMPAWKERHVPDLGLALVEILAYVGDYFSYYQDAVATEAYLHTARQRISVRRHARLVDYQLHEGCNARAFVHVEVEGNVSLDPQDAFFITAHPDSKYAGQTVLSAATLENLSDDAYQPFEIACVRAPQSQPPLSVTNILELIRALVAASTSDAPAFPHAVVRFLWEQLSDDLRRCLKAQVVDDQLPLTTPTSERVIGELTNIMREFRLRDEPCCGSNAHDQPVATTSDCPASNLAIVASALEGFVSGPAQPRQQFYEAHNSIPLYTWSGRQCCLPKGATRATLKDGDPDCLPDCRNPRPGPCDCDPKKEWTLRELRCGDLLAFEEVLGPNTHLKGDANPGHRHVVRLTSVECTIDPLTCQRIVEVEWDKKDALPFSLCISSVGPVQLGCVLNEEISVARGNIVLVDHGLRTDVPQWIGEVHYASPEKECGTDDALPPPPHEPGRAELLQPVLPGDLTFAVPVNCDDSARELLAPRVHKALPAVRLFGFPMANEPSDSARAADTAPPVLISWADVVDPVNLLLRYHTLDLDEQRRIEQLLSPADARFLQEARAKVRRDEFQVFQSRQAQRAPEAATLTSTTSLVPELRGGLASLARALHAAVLWHPKPHLMASQGSAQDFVVEMDNDRRAHLRFGDDDLGRRPANAMSFYASYRRGNGKAGNVGAEKIVHLMYRNQQVGGIRAIRNVSAAQGGCDPETLDHARLIAPRQYLKQRRAITADDYATLAQQDFADEVQQARATLNWMGSWYEATVVIDPFASVRDPEQLRRKVALRLERYRRIGHLLQVTLPVYVGLDIAMNVWVEAGYLKSHVRQAVLDVFGSGVRDDGTKGFFSPDNFSFGDSLYLSRIVSACKRVAGVENVVVTRLERFGHPNNSALDDGLLRFAAIEIPRLNNDPLHPELGRLCLDIRGQR